MATAPDPVFYDHVVRELVQGSLTPFLGAGVNLLSPLPAEPFVPGRRLPSGAELAKDLAKSFHYPQGDDDLLHVSQWVSLWLGTDALYRYLHGIFDRDYTPSPLHHVLARMPRVVREQDGEEYPLFITTNFDDALERALRDANEPFDLLTYLAQGEDQGKFRHTAASGKSRVINRPGRYDLLNLAERPVILKIHGAVIRGARIPDDDSYVVTEDDYIEALTRTDIVSILPVSIVRRMQHCHYLFLGYSLRDWNLRAILHRIRRDRTLGNNSWVVSENPDPFEEKAWRARGVEMYDLDLTEFAHALDAMMAPAKEQANG